MKPRLQASLGQHLVMTPQLRQAIRLLQLSGAELELEIAEAVESNPLLDWEEPAPPEARVDGSAGERPEGDDGWVLIGGSAINRVWRTADGGDVEDLQMQLGERQHERVGAGDGFVVLAFQTGTRQCVRAEEPFDRGVSN